MGQKLFVSTMNFLTLSKQRKTLENQCPYGTDSGKCSEENLDKKLWSSVRLRSDSQIEMKLKVIPISGNKHDVTTVRKFNEIWTELDQMETEVQGMQSKLKRAKWPKLSICSRNVSTLFIPSTKSSFDEISILRI